MRGEPLAVFTGEKNGARVEVFDLTSPYAYRNIFHLKLEVVATFPGCEEPMVRLLEKMGVLEEDLARAREELLESFKTAQLPYLLREDFPERYAQAKRREKPGACGYGSDP